MLELYLSFQRKTFLWTNENSLRFKRNFEHEMASDILQYKVLKILIVQSEKNQYELKYSFLVGFLNQ